MKQTLKELPQKITSISFDPADEDISCHLDPRQVDIERLCAGDVVIQDNTGVPLRGPGAYDTNNGMVAYRTPDGRLWCIPLGAICHQWLSPLQNRDPTLRNKLKETYGESGENVTEALVKAGYVQAPFYIPHSNDAGRWGHNLVTSASMRSYMHQLV